MWVVSSGLFGDVGVGVGGSFLGCGNGGDWVCLVYLGVWYGIAGCRVEAMCDWGWVPRFALKYIELVGVWSLYMGLTCFTSEVGCAECYWWLYVGFNGDGGCMVCRRGVVVWGGSAVLTGFFGWVLRWRVGSGLIWSRGLGGCVYYFAEREC